MTITLDGTVEASAPVRCLMPRSGRYIVPARLLGTALAHAAAHAMNTGGSVSEEIERTFIRYKDAATADAARSLGRRISDALDAERRLTSDRLVQIVWDATLCAVGRRVQVHGWIPGHLTAADGDHSVLVELTGGVCPQCGVNPTCHGADRTRIRCLNTDECGWHN